MRRRLLWSGAVGIVILQLVLVVSIASQPLRVNFHLDGRSLIWGLHYDTVHRAGPGADFFALYHAGIMLERGESPYASKEVPQVTPEYYPFRYLPIVAETVGRAATLLPPRVAYVTWVVLLELVLVGLVLVLWRTTGATPWRPALAAVLVLSSPYLLELHVGQFTFAACALLVTALVLLDRRDPPSTNRLSVGGSAALAGAALLKVFPLVACAALLRDRRGRIAAGIAGAAVMVSSVAYFAFHPDEWSAFVNVNFGATELADFHGGNHGFVYVALLVTRSLAGQPGVDGFLEVSRWWQPVVIGFTAAVIVWRRPTMLTGGIALTLAHMISYKHVWEHHASGAVVLGVFLVVRLLDAGGWRRWAAFACVVVLALPTPFALIDAYDPFREPQWPLAWWFVIPACKAVPTFALWVLALMQGVRESSPRTSPAAPPAQTTLTLTST